MVKFKMKKFIIFITVMFLATSIFAQGIEFFHGTFNKALLKAKKENKSIYIDFYTSWCGPCKKMSKEYFPKKEVGDYFNKHFVSLKIDAEKGEGVKLSEKYKIIGFPTSLFLNSEGNEIKRMVGIPSNPSGLVYIAKLAIGEEQDFLSIYKKYEEGNRTPAFIRKMLYKLSNYAQTFNTHKKREKWYKKLDKIVDEYLSSKSIEETCNKEDFKLISTFMSFGRNDNPYVEYIYDHYDDFKKIIPVADLSAFVTESNRSSIEMSSYYIGDVKFRKYVEDIKGRLAQAYKDSKEGSAEKAYEKTKYVAEAGYGLSILKDVDLYLKWRKKYHNLFRENKKELLSAYQETVSFLNIEEKKIITAKQAKKIISLIKKAIKLDKDSMELYISLGDYYAFLKDKKNAKLNYNKVLDSIKKGKFKKDYKKEIKNKIKALNN